MSIENITGMGAISGYNDEREQSGQQDDAQAEQAIIDLLVQRYGVSYSQAAAILAAVRGVRSNLAELANGLQAGDPAVVSQFETYIL